MHHHFPTGYERRVCALHASLFSARVVSTSPFRFGEYFQFSFYHAKRERYVGRPRRKRRPFRRLENIPPCIYRRFINITGSVRVHCRTFKPHVSRHPYSVVDLLVSIFADEYTSRTRTICPARYPGLFSNLRISSLGF